MAVFAIIHIATANIGAAADDARESGLQSHLGTSKETSTRVIELSLEQCITIALAENHQRPASRQALAIAEAQHRQVLAAYWPQVHLQAGYLRTDEPPDFLFPPTIFGVPPQSISIAPSSALVTIPTNAFAPGFPPQDVQLPVSVPGQDFAVSGSSFPVPEQDIKLLNDEVTTASASVKWLLFGGGLRRGLREQTAGAMAIAEQGVRRTDLQVIDSVTRIYQGAVVARQVHDVGRDTLARMEATLSLTESLYKEGTGTVKKTDYLSNKVMVETLRSAVALLEKNLSISRAALANTMGYGWEVSVEPSATVIPYEPHSADLSRMVSAAYQFNPDWATVGAAIEAAAGSLREARSGHFPRVALLGSVNRLWNDYDFGISTKTNKESATVGVVIDFPLFEGKATINKVKEAQARLAQLKEQEILLKEGLGLQIRDILLSLEAAQNRFGATREAMVSSTENRKLNIRAYQNELVETEDVIRAQLVEALMSAQHYRVAYDHAATRSKLNLVVGTEVRDLLGFK